jgi:hypothetical protein
MTLPETCIRRPVLASVLSLVILLVGLISYQRLSVRELASTIRRAPDIPALVQCAADVRALSHSLVAQGVAARHLTRMISSLNDQIAVRILELKAPAHDLSGLALCWLGMGSEGRGEQTIATDQDNGLIFVTNDEGIAPDAVRERLLPFARAANEAMDRCGYPLCKGGVMAMNPRWCASLDEWKAAFANWIDRGDPDSLLAANVFFDFRPLWGDSILAEALRADIAAHAEANARFLKQMSDNALRNRPPLNWRGELQGALMAIDATEALLDFAESDRELDRALARFGRGDARLMAAEGNVNASHRKREQQLPMQSGDAGNSQQLANFGINADVALERNARAARDIYAESLQILR